MIMTIEIRLGFVLDDSETDEADLGLKIGAFATAHFCFINIFFL